MKLRFTAPVTIVLLLSLLSAGPLGGDEKLADHACRSVDMQYEAPRGVTFYSEVTVD